MSGRLNHNPAEVIQQLLVDLGFGVLGGDDGPWPIYVDTLPDMETSSDESMFVGNTEPILQGKTQLQDAYGFSWTTERYGISIQARSADSDGYLKLKRIAETFDNRNLVYRRLVTVDMSTYRIHAVHRQSGVLQLGREKTSRRRLYTLNVTAGIQMVTTGTGTGTGP